ncbi:multiple ankyrin repeats single kh domain-containing protein [Colletotrichum kahawae]|uniref:Multiple ankyrin repeats single kh domain-containing protein n=1 Tax=Colletotrichum kahawae TaxID=34407 RepID=A0AAD9Y3N6_COLKA|nr:multiple ankyrin repeats single kh domain-containing protein [Colletotrichum kahawae]
MRLSFSSHYYDGREGTQRGLIGSLGQTALHAALLGGNTATAICLLAAGAKLVGGELVMATWNRQFELIGSLLDKGASFEDECTIFSTDTMLEAAILSQNTDLVRQVLAADRRLVTGQALCASVCLAKATGDFAILRHLLHYTPKLLASEDTWVGTAMCLSVHLGCNEIPEMMLNSGLRPETSWSLAWSLEVRNFETYNELRGSERSTSASSVTRRYLSWRRALRTRPEDEYQPALGRPIIEVAVSLNSLDYLKLLLAYGYLPGPTSPLGIFCWSRMDIDILRLLHSVGIKMTERVLGCVISRGWDREATDWLLSIGVDINERPDNIKSLGLAIANTFSPWTPLQLAAREGNFDLIERLIHYGADVNEPPYPCGGSTSLRIAADEGYFGIVQRLLELGADPNISGAGPLPRRTAIESAAQRGRLDIVQLLLNSGVKTSGCYRRQFVRSVAFAKREGHHAIVRLLKSHGGWTGADEDLLAHKDLIPTYTPPEMRAKSYVRRYFGDESDEEGPARSATLEEDQVKEEVTSDTEVCQSSVGFDSDLEEHASNSEEISQALAKENLSRGADTSETWLSSDDTCCRVQELTEELDEPPEALLSTLDPVSNLPGAYEALSKEVGLKYLPSSISYQIREEMEGDGCLEESGGDLWAEEYSRFVTDLM